MRRIALTLSVAAALLLGGCLSARAEDTERGLLADRVAALAPRVPRSHPRLIAAASGVLEPEGRHRHRQQRRSLHPALPSGQASPGHEFAVARGSREDLVLFGGERARAAESGGAALEGLFAVVSREAGRPAAFFALEATRARAPGFACGASAPATVEAEMAPALAIIDVRVGAPTTLSFTLPYAPRRVEGIAAERVAYDAAASTVRLALDSGAVVRLAR